LQDISVPSGIKSALNSLPPDLKTTYEAIFKKLVSKGEWDFKVVKHALMWIMCSEEPLSKRLWAEATHWAVPDAGTVKHSTLLELCHDFVVFDNESNVVRFAHLSVREYLEEGPFKNDDIHGEVAKCCFKYFESEPEFQKTSRTEGIQGVFYRLLI
jgi:hypothetical protein